MKSDNSEADSAQRHDKGHRRDASQFFVAGELCRRGLVAVVTLGNGSGRAIGSQPSVGEYRDSFATLRMTRGAARTSLMNCSQESRSGMTESSAPVLPRCATGMALKA